MTHDSATTIAAGVITIERIFDAPRDLVWKAWTDPEHFKQWWGPQGFTSPVATIDLSVGGTYFYGMTAPNGHTMYNTGVFQEIVPPERLVFTQSMADENGTVISPAALGMGDAMPLETVISVTLEDLDGKTKLTLRHAGFPANQPLDMAGAGWNQSLDKLAATLG